MITGFNTDIEYEGVTYHVQTEDKGLKTPLILSLVYDRGTILASKRASYDDLLKEDFDETILAARLQKQHKTICAAVRCGRLEDLKRMTAENSAQTPKAAPTEAGAAAAMIVAPITGKLPERQIPKPANADNFGEKKKASAKLVSKPEFFQNRPAQKLAERIDRAKAENVEQTPPSSLQPFAEIPKPKQELVWEVPVKIVTEDLIVGTFEIIEEEPILEAVQILTDFAKPAAPKNDRLQLEFINETAFKGGDRKTISIFVHRGNRESGIGAAQIMVKVLGSSFRPLIFHAQTDTNGVATVHLQLPHFRSGRAAILVRAMSGGEETELRRIVAHG